MVSLLALVACGGSVVRLEPPGDGGSGDDSTPTPGCPSETYVGKGGECSTDGAQCLGLVSIPSCSGDPGGSPTTAECTCAGGTWACPIGFSGGCPGPIVPCPVPSSITQGGACTTDSSLVCTSNIPIPTCNGQPSGDITCSCLQGTWSCEQFGGPACIIDASAPCPNPNSTFAGQGCATYGMTCGGDALSCGGTTVYDALACVAGVWNVVAKTSCDIDASVSDAEGPDGGI
jgi:hypothetical protein